MDPQDFAWLRRRDEVIDADHPDHEYWMEAAAIEDWIAEGAPPLGPTNPSHEGTPAARPELPARPQRPDLPTVALAVSPERAAALLDVSRDYFDKHVKPDIRVVSQGRRILVTIRELERWLSEREAHALSE